ncbi:MAG: PD40 domain-containing protein [Spirochaetes bacterium]|nr:PD40 domain-containing protein [Spirochaetota bacterium]
MYKKLVLLILLLICRNVSAENRIDADRNWKQLKTAHFNIFFPEGSEKTALIASKIAEDAYAHTSGILNHKMQTVVPVIVFPSEIKFQQNNILTEKIPEEIGGFTEFFKGRVVVPYTGDIPEFRHVLSHEIVHAFQYDLLKSMDKSVFSFINFPLWYIEGMAEYISSGYDESADMFMRDAVINNLFIDLKNFNRNRYYTGYQAYKQGQSFFYFMSQVYGEKLISKIFTDAVSLSGFEKSLELNFGKKIFEINKEWFRFYSRRYDVLIRDREFDDESGKLLRNHVISRAFYNFHPSISPNGKKIAFITTDNYAFKLTVADYSDGELKNMEDIDGGWYDTATQYLNVMSNKISWTGDSRKIIYSVQSRDRKIVRIYDTASDSKINVVLPFEDVRNPAADAEGTSLLFAAQQNNSTDIFSINTEKNETIQITSDFFTEKCPVFSKDKKIIYFASNSNRKNDFQSEKYNIFAYDISTGKTSRIIEINSLIEGMSISDDGKTILFSSDKNGISNIYSFNTETSTLKKHSNVLNGVFSPVMKDGKIYCSAYGFLGYDIMELDYGKEFEITDEMTGIRYIHDYPEPDNHIGDVFTGPDNSLYKDTLFFMLGGTVGYGVTGVAFGRFSDLYGDRLLQFSAEYLYFDEFQKDINFNVSYLFLEKRPDFYAGVFRQKNPFAFYSVESFNDFFNNAYNNTVSSYRYGVYAGIEYPFTRFTSLGLDFTSYRYERIYDDDSAIEDIKASLNQVSSVFKSSNLIYGLFGPVAGGAFTVRLSETADIYNTDYNFQNIDVSADKYYNLDNILIFSFNLNSGLLINGRDDVLYSLGGYNSLRGYGYNEFTGSKFFLFTAETEFVLLESIELGLGTGWRVNKLGFALFADAGSVWNDDYSFKDGKRFDDLKIDYGYGFRLHISSELYLKLDVAYAWDGVNQEGKQIQFSISMN